MKKAPQRGALSYLPVGAGVRVDPLGEGLMLVVPDGFRPLACPAAALPAPFDMPLFTPVELPVVVPPTEDPAVVPVAAEPPPVEVPPDCASANVLVSASAIANPIVASFMIVPFLVRNG